MEKRIQTRLASVQSKIRNAFYIKSTDSGQEHFVKAHFVKNGEPQELSFFAVTQDDYEKIEHDVENVSSDFIEIDK